ncbi:MAG: hypothetical protein LAP38_03880 [Acidobacteriia bacterium]|nr:hypothetical protein [Terriglobia bacterium]
MRVRHRSQLTFTILAALAVVLPARGFQPAQAVKVLASAEHEVGGVKVELLEAKRDSPTVVTVRWRYRNETNESKQLTHQRTGWMDPYRLSVESYLLDEVKQIKFPVSRDDDRRPVASRNGQPNQYISIRPKATIEVWAKYIVPESSGTVTVAIDGISPFGKIAITK